MKSKKNQHGRNWSPGMHKFHQARWPQAIDAAAEPRNPPIPKGWVCTSCGQERAHADSCSGPRAFRTID